MTLSSTKRNFSTLIFHFEAGTHSKMKIYQQISYFSKNKPFTVLLKSRELSGLFYS